MSGRSGRYPGIVRAIRALSGRSPGDPGFLRAFSGRSGRYPGVVRVVSGRCPGDPGKSSGRCPGVVRALSGRCRPGVVRAIRANRPGVIRALSGRYPGAIRALSERYPAVVKVVYCMARHRCWRSVTAAQRGFLKSTASWGRHIPGVSTEGISTACRPSGSNVMGWAATTELAPWSFRRNHWRMLHASGLVAVFCWGNRTCCRKQLMTYLALRSFCRKCTRIREGDCRL